MTTQCDICNSSRVSCFLKAQPLDSLSGALYTYMVCSDCGLVFLDKNETVNGQAAYEDSGYYSRKPPRLKKLIELITGYFYKRRYKIVAKYKRPEYGALLDVGCGKGKFLLEAEKHGWKTFGIEPTRRSFEAARGYGLNVVDRPIANSLFTPRTFDVITLWHVLEHIPDPNNVMSILHAWLNDDGVVIIAVPNIGSFQAKFGGKLWFHLDPPRHLYHFSPATLQMVLRKNGFIPERLLFSYPELNQFGFLQTVLNKIGISPNFMFNFLKKNKNGLPQTKTGLFLNLFACLLVLLIFGIPLILCSFGEDLLKRSGTIVVIARKKPTIPVNESN